MYLPIGPALHQLSSFKNLLSSLKQKGDMTTYNCILTMLDIGLQCSEHKPG